MAVTLTVGTAAGLNYDQYLGTSSSSFLYGHTANPAYGEFYGTGHSVSGGPQHLVSGSAVDGTVSPTEKAVLAAGDFDYTFGTHTLDGTLNKVEFGYGPALLEAYAKLGGHEEPKGRLARLVDFHPPMEERVERVSAELSGTPALGSITPGG